MSYDKIFFTYVCDNTKMFDNTAIADRFRTVSRSNDSYSTYVVNLVYGPNRPIHNNSRT